MTKKKIFITGAAGCVGHYLLDRFLPRTDLELHLLVRSSSKFKIDLSVYKNVHIHEGNMRDIEDLEDVIVDMDYVVHMATPWSSARDAKLVNVEKTMKLFDMCEKGRCKRVIYFSTASILGDGNKLIEAAGTHGSGYIKSKYLAHQALDRHSFRDSIVTVFPTLVVGGDATHPASHISEGLAEKTNWFRFLRFLKIDASFHFLHAKDIAAMADILLWEEKVNHEYVIGCDVVTANEAFTKVAKVYNMPLYFQIPVSLPFIKRLCKVLRIKIGPWEDYLLSNPHFVYDVVNPANFGQPVSFPTWESVVQDVKDNLR